MRNVGSRPSVRAVLLVAYAILADIVVCAVVLPFQRYAIVTARSDDSTPSTVLALLLCDLLMLLYVLSGMAANGALIRLCLSRVPRRKNFRR